ncbi:MAG: hypothetical protein ACI9F9_002875, partial [Candidatus Paceibacteria bacterium]
MNNTRFISRYLALSAIFAGLSAPAFAIQNCGDPVNCGPLEVGPFSTA